MLAPAYPDGVPLRINRLRSPVVPFHVGGAVGSKIPVHVTCINESGKADPAAFVPTCAHKLDQAPAQVDCESGAWRFAKGRHAAKTTPRGAE